MKNQRFWVLAGAMALLVGSLGGATGGYVAIAQSTSQNSAPATTESRPDGMKKRRHRIDFAAAATKLGVTEAQLKTALGVPAQRQKRPRLDLQATATKLGVTEAQLQQALGITIDPQTGRPMRPKTRPNLQAAATQLGVTKAQLKAAMGLPAKGDRTHQRPRLDISGAATKLGVTQQQLVDALGIPAQPPSAVPN
jgi:hypothetical protein